MEKYTLQEYANLLQNLRMMKEFYSNGEEEKNVGYLTYDSREVTEGTLFICKGAAFKAEYLDAAIEKGAIAYVSEVKYETISVRRCLHLQRSSIMHRGRN